MNVPLRNEAARRFLVAFEGDDDAFGQTLDPEIEWCPIGLDVDEVVEEGDDVVALIHLTGRGRGSGAPGDVRFYAQVKVRDGKTAYIYDHEDKAAALEAAGVPDPTS